MFLFETQAAGGWDSFKTGMESFFMEGLGSTGLQGLAIAVMVIGLVGALFSFVWHKFNQQSRLPGPLVMLAIGVAGAIGSFGIDKPIAILKNVATWVLSLFGV